MEKKLLVFILSLLTAAGSIGQIALERAHVDKETGKALRVSSPSDFRA